MKKRVSIYIDAELIKTAHELGLNVSKVCENALKEAIERLTQTNIKTNPKSGGPAGI